MSRKNRKVWATRLERKDEPRKKTSKRIEPVPIKTEPKWTDHIPLAIVVAIGAFLRLFHLGTEPLWLDEASTLTFARDTLTGVWVSMINGEFNPPTFYWIEHFMIGLGDSEFILRLVPALFGIVTIIVFYYIGLELRDRNTGLVAAALVAFSGFAVAYSQEARAYMMMLLFVAMTFVFFLRMLKKNDAKNELLFAMSSAAALWSHFYSIIPVGLLIIFLLIFKRKEITFNAGKIPTTGIAIIGFIALSLPLLVYGLDLFTKRSGSGPTFGISGYDVLSQTFIQISGFSYILALLFLALFIAGTFLYLKTDTKITFILAALLLIPIFLSILLSYKIAVVPRYLIYLQAFFFPGIALIATPIYERLKSQKIVYVLIALFLVVNLPYLYGYYTVQQKDDWRGAAQQLRIAGRSGDIVMTIPGYVRQPLNYYYSNSTQGTLEYAPYTVNEIESIISSHPGHTYWFVVTGDVGSIDPHGEIVSWLRANTKIVWYDPHGSIILGAMSK